MKLLKSFGWTTVATVTTVLCSLSFYKVFSFFLGPPGVALLSHLQNILSILITLPQDGINRGLIKYISGENTHSSVYWKYVFAAFLIHLLIFLCSLPLLYFLLTQANGLPAFLHSGPFFILFSFSTLIQISILFFYALLISAQKLKIFAIASISNSLLTLALVYLGLRYSSYEACVALLIAPLVVFLLLIFKMQSILKTRFSLSVKNYNLPALKDLSHFLLAAGSTLIFGRIVEFFVRVFALARFDPYQTGLWQSAVKLSDGYTSLFSGIIGIVFFPKIASLINNKHDVRKTFLKMSSVITLLVFAGLFFIFIFQKFILTLVFNDTFIQAKLFLDFQLLSDAFKLVSWLMMYLVIARAEMKLYLLLEFISALTYILFLGYFSNEYGTLGLAYANLGRYVLYFTIVSIITVYYFIKNSRDPASLQDAAIK